jgi:hypothetical protein
MGALAKASTTQWMIVRALIAEAGEIRCSFSDGEAILVLPMVGRRLQPNDIVSILSTDSTNTSPNLLVKRSGAARSTEMLFTTVGRAVAIPQRETGQCVEVEVPHSNALEKLYLSALAIREYFFALAGEDSPGNQLYEALSTHSNATLTELRLAWRLKSIELALSGDQRIKKSHIERAFNILANPALKECYERIRPDDDALPLFPYGGYGSILVEGRLIEDGKAFIGNRILAFKPDMEERKVSILLRSCEFLPDRIVSLDSRRKLEVWLDGGLLPGLNWDPSWNNWKHWIRSRLEVEATFVTSAKERIEQCERIVNKWSVALPSRLRVTVPEGLMADIDGARAFHALLGRHADLVRQIAAQIDSSPAEHSLVEKWFRDFNAEPELRPQHVNWQPDYDEFYFEELRKGSKTWFLFRGEYLFVWHRILIAEIPALGHATYIFSRPANLEEFMAAYAKTERDDVRRNRHDVASRLGFIGRVVRGQRKMRWLNDVLKRAGEQVEVGDTPDWPGASG